LKIEADIKGTPVFELDDDETQVSESDFSEKASISSLTINKEVTPQVAKTTGYDCTSPVKMGEIAESQMIEQQLL
jgi:hypothetical protein